MEEQELIQGCITQDRTSQRAVFERYAGKLFGVCQRYTNRSDEADDILQEAFIKIFNQIHTFAFAGSFEGWMRRIVVNTAIRHYQQRRQQYAQTFSLSEMNDVTVDPTVYDELQEEDLLEMIGRLPEGYRMVFNLYAIEGFSHREIAETLHIEESTSRSQLVKARKMLQQMILVVEKVAV